MFILVLLLSFRFIRERSLFLYEATLKGTWDLRGVLFYLKCDIGILARFFRPPFWCTCPALLSFQVGPMPPQAHTAFVWAYTFMLHGSPFRGMECVLVQFYQSWALSVFLNFFNNKKMIFCNFYQFKLTGSGFFK